MDICIIGCGWYGCYVAEKLLQYKNIKINITMIDKEDDIFKGSSSNNQNRLHLGFHYPRCDITMKKCEKYFDEFVKKYSLLLENIENNIYCVAKDSKVNYKDYISKFKNYELLDNQELKNIEGSLIKVNEKYINFVKAKKYFLGILTGKVEFLLNYNVEKITQRDNKVIINNDLLFDKVINCTYNQIKDNTSDVIYEKCITLLYKKINSTFFDTLTVMDGDYFSIYKYKDDLFNLTNVKYTPICKGSFEDVTNYEIESLIPTIQKFEDQVKQTYPNFKKSFEYEGYYISYKCKNICKNDSRDINISINNNIMNIWCGKISLVFDIDNKLFEFINN